MVDHQKSSIISGLNDRQWEAVQQLNGPLIVLAGAGSGKTKMLTSRIVHLIESGQALPYQILAVTFTNKAAAEMRARVERLMQTARVGLGFPEIGTFHSVCVRILRRELRNPLKGLPVFTKPFVIYDDSDQLSLIKSVMDKLKIDEKSFSPKAIQAGINRAKCDALEPHELIEASQNPLDVFKRQLQRVYEQYQKDLIANSALDFGEIICLTYRLFRDQSEIRTYYQNRFKYIHVDEFQDTNRSQYLLLSMLSSSRYGGHENICVVGDEDQSIYKWRGADIRNILDFELDYPSAKLVKLEQNYRSTQSILSVANHLIRNNKARKHKELWTENARGNPVIRAQLADERSEAEMVISEIQKHAASDGRAYSDFAIFYRTNAQSRQFEDVLRREKLPYDIVGGLRFYDRKEIKDILSYLKCIFNSSDSISLKRIINTPARGIGKSTLDKLEAHYAQIQDQGFSFWDAVQQFAANPVLSSSAVAKKLVKFVELMQRLTEQQSRLSLVELYHLILDETGYVLQLKQEGTEEAMSRIANLEEFDTLLVEFEEEQLGSAQGPERDKKKADLLATFIEQSSLASELLPKDTSLSSVKLMTLHSSKGLEFPVAFIVGMEEGLFPSTKPWEQTPEEDIEEERRLCYVGMTRAREVLYLLHVGIRRLWGQVTAQDPSRFFSELPDDEIETRDYSYGNRASEFRQGSSRVFMSGVTGAGVEEHVYAHRQMHGDWVGRRLRHPEYGPGTVLVSEGSGSDQKLTVQFLDRQQRKFLLRYILNYF